MPLVAESNALDDRAQRLLKALVERYVADGQPVGSRTLARELNLELSPATIRNVMADLEALGFIDSPHTSAGRVPTVRGYRFFVDTLLSVKPLADTEVQSMSNTLTPGQQSAELVENASSLLSAVTHMAGVVTLPRHERLELRHIEFLRLSDRRVLTILVVNEQEVQNRIIEVQRDFTPAELTEIANFLNERFLGRDLKHIRKTLLAEMREAREHMNRMMINAIDMAEQVFKDPAGRDDYILAGETNLMGFAELGALEKLKDLFDAFYQKREILLLLDQCINTDGVQIFIGDESGYKVLDECSLVTAPYSVDGELVGVLGVIGPTRMAYDRVIPIVDLTARLLGAALKHHN
ncbi:MAG: heat-inducible transcriptional repressor HrcA [Gammaproteobacteria bacterium]|nr:MAG: heat-inducible transcriptional repressor HrcA [Gammaproteobacteria bacterium]